MSRQILERPRAGGALQGPDPAAGEIGEEIRSLKILLRAAIDIASRDRLTETAIIKMDRVRIVRERSGIERSLGGTPAVIGASPSEIDLFVGALADIADIHLAGQTVEAHAPWVAQAGRINSRSHRTACEPIDGSRIVRRQGVVPGSIHREGIGPHVEPQDLAQLV